MIGIMKDGAFHWRFNDTENKLKASTLPVRVLRDSRQIFVQCRERKKRNHPKSTTQTKQKKRRKKKRRGKKKLLDINSSLVLWGFVLPVQAENLYGDPDGLFNEMFL